MARRRRGFGRIEKRSSGRYRAAYTGPNAMLYRAPDTFANRGDAEGWLATAKRRIDLGTWTPPNARPVAARKALTFEPYAATFLVERNLKPSTREHYAKLLRNQINPTFGDMAIPSITPYMVRSWHSELGTRNPTQRSHAYALLRTILGEAVNDELIPANPAHIRGAGNSKRVHKIRPATLGELEVITAAMPERYRLMVLLAAWCGLRFGELTELRRDDVDTKHGVLRVRRAVVWVGGEFVVGTPKSDAGIRDVNIPPHLLPVVREHLRDNIAGGRNGLLFPASDGITHMTPSTLYKGYYPARNKAGRPDLRFHDLRHTGAVLAAATGATLPELMARLGHSTVDAALRYQHASQDRDKVIAEALSAMVTPR